MFTYTTHSKFPYKCPICQGCGNVPGGFYNATIGHITSWIADSAAEQCRSCHGTGIIWAKNEEEDGK